MFKKRSEKTETMDDLAFGGEEMNVTLEELQTINKWLGGNSVTFTGLNSLVSDCETPLSIADIGCGRGDKLKLMVQWSQARGFKTHFTGIDANPFIIDFARKNTDAYPEITYHCLNIFSDDFQKQKFDIICCTLFTHHFNNKELVTLLKRLQKQTKFGIVINDLHRHWLAYYSIKFITALFSNSNMIKNDAPISVLRSFTRNDWLEILSQAGIQNYSLSWKWAFRWQLIIKK